MPITNLVREINHEITELSKSDPRPGTGKPCFSNAFGNVPDVRCHHFRLKRLGNRGLATLFVLLLSNAAIATVKNFIPATIRIPCFITIIASFVTVVDLLMSAYLPTLHAALGIYIPLIVVNCIILGRAEAFASKNTIGQSLLDAAGMGLGFTWALTALGFIRELLGAGTAFGFNLLGDDASPALLFIMPPGAFLALAGLIICLINCGGHNYELFNDFHRRNLR